MSQSFAVLPLDDKVREWLAGEGHGGLPLRNGRQSTLGELRTAIEMLQGIEATWSGSVRSPEVSLVSSTGLHTSILVSEAQNDAGFSKFHFRGGHTQLVEQVVEALSALAGPQLIYEHSGSFTKVVHAS